MNYCEMPGRTGTMQASWFFLIDLAPCSITNTTSFCLISFNQASINPSETKKTRHNAKFAHPQR